MAFFTVLLLIEIISIGICIWTIKKLYAYINQYRFSESVYTLLFGFIRLRYFVYLYGIFVLLSAVLGTFIAFSALRS